MTAATLERGLTALKEHIDAPVAAFFSSCVHCGLCAEACLFYTETGDPKYAPIRKLEPLRRQWRREYTLVGRLGALLGLIKPLTDDELAEWAHLIYDSCTMCGRCTLVCPVGNDLTYMIRKLREGMAASGHARKGLVEAAKKTIKLGSPMGVQLPALNAQIRRVEAEVGLPIPVDVAGVDYMVILSSMEVIQFPEIIGALARIFDRAGVTWTIPSSGFEATNVGIQIGSRDIAEEIVRRVVEAAEKLRVKYVISPECGHAYVALRWEGPNLLGRPYRFEVIHLMELLAKLRAEGRLPLAGKHDQRVTFHDPCQIIRRGGIDQEPRDLLNEITEDFAEMPDAGIWNWCCGGGGGVSAVDEAEHLRTKVFSRKMCQLDEVHPEQLVTACANCRNIIEEGLEAYNKDIEVIGLTELVAEYLAPDETAPAEGGDGS